MLAHRVRQALQRSLLRVRETRQGQGLRLTLCRGLQPSLMAAVVQGIGQGLLHGGQLHAEAVELFVLGAGGVTLLAQHRLLEQADRLAQGLR